MEKSKLKEWLSALLDAVIIAVILYFLFWPFMIEGASMENTFETNDMVLVSRISAYLNFIDYNDIILCKIEEEDSEEIIIKRIIGKPGDHIEIKDNQVYINNSLLIEPYLKEQKSTEGNIDITLGEDEYYVLGDNRKRSTDSRYFGTIKSDAITAKVVFKIYPLSSIGFVN